MTALLGRCERCRFRWAQERRLCRTCQRDEMVTAEMTRQETAAVEAVTRERRTIVVDGEEYVVVFDGT